MEPASGNAARHGWSSSFPDFTNATALAIRGSLAAFLRDSSKQQVRAWDDSIPPLQHEVREVLDADLYAAEYSAILEYELPLEQRRPDVILLLGQSVLVLEIKGKAVALRADVDQAAAYARDLRSYHRDCADREVASALVLVRGRGRLGKESEVHIVGMDAVDDLAEEIGVDAGSNPIDAHRFLEAEAYRPLPTLVQAARELFEHGDLGRLHRKVGATEPALNAITAIVREAAATKTRRLVLLTGIPGAGKTLVGLELAHARFLDDLSVARQGLQPTSPAVFLSGNGPLVEVLQYELREVGDGKTFVRGIKDYVERYTLRPDLVPPEHVLIFDEAQRAWDADRVTSKHGGRGDGRSEPEHFVEFAERIPDWCVVVGLIGSGQEIHEGEEGGLVQWRAAVEGSHRSADWTVHLPPGVAQVMDGLPRVRVEPALHLAVEVRYHVAQRVHDYVDELLTGTVAEILRTEADDLDAQGYHLRITRDLGTAKQYLRDRYGEQPMARFGLLASSKDKDLVRFGVPNDFQSTKRVHFGPWFGEGDGDYLGRSCRTLRDCVTEFGSQGLELDSVLLAWGTDFIREDGHWTNRLARGYLRRAHIRDPFQLRLNAYRVLLTRGRDGTVVFVPPMPAMDETYAHLIAAGFRSLDTPL